jgi:hypothetical protein
VANGDVVGGAGTLYQIRRGAVLGLPMAAVRRILLGYGPDVSFAALTVAGYVRSVHLWDASGCGYESVESSLNA